MSLQSLTGNVNNPNAVASGQDMNAANGQLANPLQWNATKGRHLRNGGVQSCGCHRRDSMAKRIKAHPEWTASASRAMQTHGYGARLEDGRRNLTYKIWGSMRQRCENPNAENYPYYGGRGIAVCERWQKFENFLADMGEKPDGLSIDRIDNSKGYEPGNCRWTTSSEQNRNRRPLRRGEDGRYSAA
jgi:hypothetical protein